MDYREKIKTGCGIFCAVFFFACMVIPGLVFGQSGGSFDIDKLTSQKDAFAVSNANMLHNYFICRAAVQGDEAEIYRIPDSSMQEDVLKNFNEVDGVFGTLIRKKDSEAALKIAKKQNVPHAFEPLYREILQAIATGNTAKCNVSTEEAGRNFCLACITMNPSMVSNQKNKDIVTYLGALQKSDPTMCNRITSPYIKAMCIGAASKDFTECAKESDFQKFKALFYQQKRGAK